MQNKKVLSRLSWGVLGVFMFLPSAFAQKQGNPTFELRKFYVDELKSPGLTGKSFDYTENSQDWLQIVCEFRATHEDQWLDNITFKWNVTLLGSEKGPVVFTKQVTYDKVEADGKKDQRVPIFLSPRDIRRWYASRGAVPGDGKVVVFVEVLADGIKVAEFEHPKGRVQGVPANWWASRNVRRADNIFLSRVESPWSNHDHDTWVPERPSDKPASR